MCGLFFSPRPVQSEGAVALRQPPTARWSPCAMFGQRHLAGSAATSPRDQVAAALSVLAPALAGALVLFVVLPQASWIVFAFGWMLFPWVGLLARGVNELAPVTAPRRDPATVVRGGLDRVTDLVTEVRQRTMAPTPSVAARLGHLRHTAGQIEAPATRDVALRVCQAAERTAAVMTTTADVDHRLQLHLDGLLARTDAILTPYVRLARDRDPAATPTLTWVEQEGLPLLASSFDTLTATVRAPELHPVEHGDPSVV